MSDAIRKMLEFADRFQKPRYGAADGFAGYTLTEIAGGFGDVIAGQLARDLVDTARDGREWREQHENLLVMYRESEAELHKWRTGHQLGAMQEGLIAMQARAVEAEARLDRVRRLVSEWREPDPLYKSKLYRAPYRSCADDLEAALAGKPCE